MRLVFLGTPQAAVPSLQALIDAGLGPRLVVTQPDRPVGRSRRPSPSAVKSLALEHGLELLQPPKIRTRAFRESIAALEPDLLVVVAYGKILSPRLLEVAPRGAINVHFSLLPRYRGAAPVQWALARGETETGVTTMQLDAGMDEGDVLLAESVPILDDEHAPELRRRLAQVGASLLLRTLEQVCAGALQPRRQDHARASYAPMLHAADGELDLSLDARTVEGRIRGFDPWPGVWSVHRGQRLRLAGGRAAAAPAEGLAAGRVIELGRRRLGLVCGAGSVLELLALQPAGRRTLSVADALNGRQIEPGELLTGHGEVDGDEV